MTGIVIAGVGGQGTLLASRIIGVAAIKNSMEVKVSEVHGMAQRGGSVITFVSYGESGVYSPIISPGRADVVLAFERLEAYRSVTYLRRGGAVIFNTQALSPMPVLTGAMDYPAGICEKLQAIDIKVEAIDALAMAIEAGSALAVNMVLLGRLAAVLNMPKESWLDTIKETVKPATLEINLKAFELGYSWSV